MLMKQAHDASVVLGMMLPFSIGWEVQVKLGRFLTRGANGKMERDTVTELRQAMPSQSTTSHQFCLIWIQPSARMVEDQCFSDVLCTDIIRHCPELSPLWFKPSMSPL
ncbi:hypothetical protein BU15DRAFT_60014 [Melanogaster broomeanus]|nr:hypothetical protein BU15DRAFT_60014 [Melanogaster broomeanus]